LVQEPQLVSEQLNRLVWRNWRTS